MKNKRTTTGFSTVEMMVVLAVVSTLLALAAPSLLTFGSTSLTVSGSKLQALLQQARQEATGQTTATQFVIVRNWPGEPEAAHRKYGIWEWDATLEDFVASSNWRTLPEGIVFENEIPDYVLRSSYASEDPSTIRVDSPMKVDDLKVGNTTIQASVIEFRPNGKVNVPDASSSLRIGLVLTNGFSEGGRIIRTSFRGSQARLEEQSDGSYGVSGSGGGVSEERADDQNDQDPNWVQLNIDILTGNIEIHRER